MVVIQEIFGVNRHIRAVADGFAADGYGFNCDQRGSYDAAAAKLARERTLSFFEQCLG